MGKLIDLTGQRFEQLLVLGRAEDYVSPKGRHKIRWLCRCDCGNEVVVVSDKLKNGDIKSCGCLRHEKASVTHFIDLIGQRFGRLLVLERVEDYITRKGVPLVQWRCVCDCGNEIIVRSTNLKSGNTKSCGCLRKEIASQSHFVDLMGQKFGRLTVIKRVDNYVSPKGYSYVRWLCRCDCGNEVSVLAISLMNGHTKSCGCIVRSINEQQAVDYFESNNIMYESEKSFDDLVGKRGSLLKYDFYLPEYNILLELNGSLHYEPSRRADGEYDLKYKQTLDQIKEQYAIERGYKFVTIDTHKGSHNISQEQLIQKLDEMFRDGKIET